VLWQSGWCIAGCKLRDDKLRVAAEGARLPVTT
jgi:hypothetical protein